MNTTNANTSKKNVAPYGSWETPFTASAIVQDTIGYGTIVVDMGDIYWIETRPHEEGRHVIVKRSRDGKIRDVLPRKYNARTSVHEYGGGAYTVHNGVVYFCQYDTQQLYRMAPGQEPECLNTLPGMRFAEPVFDKRFNRLIAVCEDHRKEDEEPVNSLVSIDLDKLGEYRFLASGLDFYAQPKISPDGKKLAWLGWKHPNMPWDYTQLYTAELSESGKLGKPTLVAGSEKESIVQPEWSPDGELYFVSDRTGWWNIHRLRAGKIECMFETKAEFTRPSWHLGYSQYAFLNAEEMLCSYNIRGFWRLGMMDLLTKDIRQIKDCEFTDIWWVKVAGTKAVFRGSSPTIPQSIVTMELRSEMFSTIATCTTLDIDPDTISVPEAIEFDSDFTQAYGLYYRPTNKNYKGPDKDKPPLLVKAHGGPTGIASTMLNLEIQYWTSRGFAVLDVNYRGSTGFGRTYRERLYGEWGSADVDDCVSGALYLVQKGEVHPEKLLISGGSAGGFTVLCAATFTNAFKAGASYYGICDLDAMANDTHKFESRYLENLVGPHATKRSLYRSRSPIHSTARLQCPLVFFQGLEDKIVPPNQTTMMVDALKKHGLPVACIMFEGEQHGFRKAETIQRSLNGELYFYSKILNFKVPADIHPIEIFNLPAVPDELVSLVSQESPEQSDEN